jgi:hypothetical protein
VHRVHVIETPVCKNMTKTPDVHEIFPQIYVVHDAIAHNVHAIATLTKNELKNSRRARDVHDGEHSHNK